jgi:putative ABC transport system ATP-binding protein
MSSTPLAYPQVVSRQSHKLWPVFVSHQHARLSSPSFGEEAFYAQIEFDEHRTYDLTTAVMAMNARADDAQEGSVRSLRIVGRRGVCASAYLGGVVHVVLGVSMAPTTVHTVLVGGENADGVIVDQDNFDTTPNGDAPTVTAPDQVISAILGAREDAAADGDQVMSTGVTWVNPADAATLREGLAVGKIENVVLVSALSAAAALARAFGSAAHYAHTALLYVEPNSATLAVVYTPDGSVVDLRQRSLPEDDDAAVAGLVEMVKGAAEMEPRPEGVFVVGSGVDIPLIKPALETAASLPVSAPEEPQRALAHGAALVSANAPLFGSSAATLARAFGSATRYAHIALLYVEPDSATLALVKTADGSAVDVGQRFLPEDDDAAVAGLVEMVKGAEEMEPRPEGVLVVGSGVDVPLIMPALEAATSLPVSAERPQRALARGAAPVLANAARLYGPAVLEARNLCKSFGREPTMTPVLKNIDLQIFPGEFVALIGPSGSGKSTLLSILGLLEPPTSGDVLVNERSVAQLSRRELAAVRGRRIGYVFQSFNLLGGLSVAENVMLPALLVGESGYAQHRRAMDLLDQFGLAGLAKRVPAELSGGEQQRVAIARALFMAPDVILADEPTGNLDTTNGHNVIDALYHLNSAGQTIVLVTHDLSIANEAPRLISFLDGRIETDTGPIQRSRNAAWRAGH